LSWEIHAAKAQSRKNAEQNRQELQRKPTFVFVSLMGNPYRQGAKPQKRRAK
jgi:hypothetical protein